MKGNIGGIVGGCGSRLFNQSVDENLAQDGKRGYDTTVAVASIHSRHPGQNLCCF